MATRCRSQSFWTPSAQCRPTAYRHGSKNGRRDTGGRLNRRRCRATRFRTCGGRRSTTAPVATGLARDSQLSLDEPEWTLPDGDVMVGVDDEWSDFASRLPWKDVADALRFTIKFRYVGRRAAQ